jgi:site-specific recombinase XerC
VNNPKLFEKNIGPKTPSSIEVIDPDKPKPIREWQQRYENYLSLIGKKATRERYARALDRFLEKHRGKTYGHQFLRPSINDYVETRLKEGASVATVRLELSAVRGLFQFMMDMGAADVFFNPARNVKVRQSKSGSVEADHNEATESPTADPAVRGTDGDS